MGNKIVILNGPPGSGKDYICSKLVERGWDHVSFKQRLFKIALTISGISEGEWFNRYEDRDLKEVPWHKLSGLSQREFMIHISEDIIKPNFGKDYFGKAAAQEVSLRNNNVSFSDGGFTEEIYPLLSLRRPVHIVQLFRDGCSFEGDSRNYINLKEDNLKTHVVYNDRNIDHVVDEILTLID